LHPQATLTMAFRVFQIGGMGENTLWFTSTPIGFVFLKFVLNETSDDNDIEL